MRSVYCFALPLATALGCTNPIPIEPPMLRGNITDTTNYGLLVVAPGAEAACDATKRAQVSIGEASIHRRSGRPAAVADLVVGTPVSVWITGPVMESCPPIMNARTLVIEEP